MSVLLQHDDLKPDDRQEIARVLGSVGVFRPEEVAIGLELVEDTLCLGPRSSYHWVLARTGDSPERAADTLAGFACYGPVPLTEGTFDLYWIALDPSSRGRGIADALDEAVADAVRLQGGRWLLAETSSTAAYEPARRFYLRRGYALLERIPDFYRPGDDRLTYGKRLDSSG